MNRDLRELLEEYECVLVDGFDSCISGVVWRSDQPVVIYSKERIIKFLMKRDGMSFEEATDFFHYNIEGSYVGEKTPLYMEEF